MLDDLFQLMHHEGFASWSVHARVLTSSGPLTLSIPHAMADGRWLLRNAVQPLLSFLDDRHSFIPIGDGGIELSGSSLGNLQDRTRFQKFLSAVLLSEQFSSSKSICLGVATRSFPEARNQVAFPVFARSELIELCQLDSDAWKTELTRRAQQEEESYSRISKMMDGRSAESRVRLFSRFPVHNSDLVISYIGGLHRFLSLESEFAARSIQCAASTSNGPERLLVCFGDDRSIKGVVTNRGDAIIDWLQGSVIWRDS